MTQNSLHSGNDDMNIAAVKNPKDRWIPWYFVIFFTVIAVLDGIFVYMAISTQTGLVTEHAYEKGLAYNQILQEARAQPAIQQKAGYEAGILRWQLADAQGVPITNARVSAHIKRPVQEGYDFDINLEHQGGGVYEAKVEPPLRGLWQAGLNSAWDDQRFHTSLNFLSR